MHASPAPEPRQSAAPYIVPFAAYMALLQVKDYVPVPVQLAIMAAVIWFFSRHVLSFRTVNPVMSALLGIGVIVVWVGPDLLFPGYRTHWLFQNSLTGQAAVPNVNVSDTVTLASRTLRAVLIVPIIEELFWRAWLMRWLIDRDFWRVPLGAYLPSAFWITAALFGVEHGTFWAVGLFCGAAFNWWMVRTKSLGDLFLAHAVANAALYAYAIGFQKWEYLP